MNLSTHAWQLSAGIVDAITCHPFNQELMHGTLGQDKFVYYIEQDSLYLQDFARCHAIIASKISLPYVKTFLKYADGALSAEQDGVHHFFKRIFNFKETGHMTPALMSYTSYLLRICSIEPVEVAVAAILPCFWIYREVGLFISTHAKSNNPYAQWFETYANPDFGASVNEAIEIFDHLSNKTTEPIRKKMLNTFYNSTCLEWHFWNDAYNKTIFDEVKING